MFELVPMDMCVNRRVQTRHVPLPGHLCGLVKLRAVREFVSGTMLCTMDLTNLEY